MADEDAVVEEGTRAAESPLVQVSFQRNVNRKQKYLEAEPKFLGVTQISLAAYQILCVSVFLANDLSVARTDIPFFILSLLVVIAGSVAVAAQNLHLPTLRACLGMQIMACAASFINIVCSLVGMEIFSFSFSYCWHYDFDNSTLHGETCHKLENAVSHFSAEGIVIQVTLLAISATLAAYCCKVVNCCTPAPKVPVITVQVPPVQQ